MLQGHQAHLVPQAGPWAQSGAEGHVIWPTAAVLSVVAPRAKAPRHYQISRSMGDPASQMIWFSALDPAYRAQNLAVK